MDHLAERVCRRELWDVDTKLDAGVEVIGKFRVVQIIRVDCHHDAAGELPSFGQDHAEEGEGKLLVTGTAADVTEPAVGIVENQHRHEIIVLNDGEQLVNYF